MFENRELAEKTNISLHRFNELLNGKSRIAKKKKVIFRKHWVSKNLLMITLKTIDRLSILKNVVRQSPIRIIEILEGKTNITSTEYDKLSEVLNIKMKPYHRDNLLLVGKIQNLDIPDSAKDSIIIYIKNSKGKHRK